MFIELSLEEAKKQHPELVKKLIEEIKTSSSKKGKFDFVGLPRIREWLNFQ